jgi:hypothetical protein
MNAKRYSEAGRDSLYSALLYAAPSSQISPLPAPVDPLQPLCRLYTPPRRLRLYQMAHMLSLRNALVDGSLPTSGRGLMLLAASNLEAFLPNVRGTGSAGVPGGLSGLYAGPFRLCSITPTRGPVFGECGRSLSYQGRSI